MRRISVRNEDGNEFYVVNCKKDFCEGWNMVIDPVNDHAHARVIDRIYNYAMACSFDSTRNDGYTQTNRSGGVHENRKNGGKFIDIFTGKLGEFALYYYFVNSGFVVEEPNVDDHRGYGNTDVNDLKIYDKCISVKTTGSFSNLLLIQKSQYNNNGEYLANLLRRERGEDVPTIFNYHVLCRFKHDKDEQYDWWMNRKNHRREGAKSFRDYNTFVNRDNFHQLIMGTKWTVDIVGYITHEEFVNEIIREDYVIPHSINVLKRYLGTRVNSLSEVDVDNYYVQSGDMHSIEGMCIELQRR